MNNLVFYFISQVWGNILTFENFILLRQTFALKDKIENMENTIQIKRKYKWLFFRYSLEWKIRINISIWLWDLSKKIKRISKKIGNC